MDEDQKNQEAEEEEPELLAVYWENKIYSGLLDE